MKKSAAIEATAVAIGAALLLVSAAAAAETYRWVDAEGKVHYSDRPVQGAAEVQIKTTEGGASNTTAPADAAAQAIRAEHCALARQRLDQYENSDKVVEEDEFGRQRELEGEERIQLIVRAHADVKSFCAGQPEIAEAQPAVEGTEEVQTEASNPEESQAAESNAEY